jgi:hypothetical protein
VFDVIKGNLHPEVSQYYWKGKKLAKAIENGEQRLGNIKKALANKSWLMHVF